MTTEATTRPCKNCGALFSRIGIGWLCPECKGSKAPGWHGIVQRDSTGVAKRLTRADRLKRFLVEEHGAEWVAANERLAREAGKR